MEHKDLRIIIKQPDGSCHIVIPAPEMFDPKSPTRQLMHNARVLPVTASNDEVMEFIRLKDVPQNLPHRITHVKNIPTDLTFRNAWTDDNPTETVDIDIKKAKEIKKEQLRIFRAPLLTRLDAEYMKAHEKGDTETLKAIAAKKQALRDITNLELPNTPEELKNFLPDV